ncbi:hypothetical protein Q3G72_001362 [Acer saccharum]|nr:hypothetical protein Q3G72_001362 [Acer saccharum]
MDSLWRAVSGQTNQLDDHDGVEFWSNPERTGWLTKQGQYIKTWRRRWFVLKQGKLFWFKESTVTRSSRTRGVIPVASCLTVKGAEDVLNKQYAFELSLRTETITLGPSPTPRSSITIASDDRRWIFCLRLA